MAAAKRAPVVANPALAKNPRRQFAISRIGIFITAVVLGLSVRMPWAVIHKPTITYKGDLFSILNHGWRTNVAQLLVAVAVFCAIQALAFPFKRIKMFSSISGIVALGLVLISITQIHTYVSPANFSNPKVSFGYGAFVALGTSAVLIMAWAVFPAGCARAAWCQSTPWASTVPSTTSWEPPPSAGSATPPAPTAWAPPWPSRWREPRVPRAPSRPWRAGT